MPARPTPLPRLMKEPAAAAYLGVSPGTLRKSCLSRRVWGGLRLYDRHDLDEWADALPYEGDGHDGDAACDDIFGLSA